MKYSSFIKKFVVAVCITILYANTLNAQMWKRYRREVFGGAGVTNFLGELGGADQIGTNFVRDLEISLTRPALTAGYRYNLTPVVKARGTLSWGILRGDDKLTQERFRNNRNLHFKSPIIELSGGIEYYFVQEQLGRRYNIKGAKGMKGKKWSAYGFVGAGVIYFNPKAEYQGRWVALQPLSTEGQGLRPGSKKYSRINVALPLAFGVNYSIDRQFKVGLELGYRKTFTDYIDDVSTDYYDNALLRQQKGNTAADLADPSLLILSGPDASGKTRDGIQRGDPDDKDAYGFAIITVSYKIQKRRSRAKF